MRMWRCRSAPGFPLGSTSGQTVSSLPSVAHESQRLAAALLEGGIQHLFVGEVHLWEVGIHQGAQPHALPGHDTGQKLKVMKRFKVPTWKIAFHVSPRASSRRSLSLQPLKYKTHGGRYWARSDANSCTKQKELKLAFHLQEKLWQGYKRRGHI